MRARSRWRSVLLLAAWLGSLVVAVEVGSRTTASPITPAHADQLEDEELRFYQKSQQAQSDLIQLMRDIRTEIGGMRECLCRQQ